MTQSSCTIASLSYGHANNVVMIAMGDVKRCSACKETYSNEGSGVKTVMRL